MRRGAADTCSPSKYLRRDPWLYYKHTIRRHISYAGGVRKRQTVT